MHPARTTLLLLPLLVDALGASLAAAPGVSYDIVYVRQPRYGSDENTHWAEVSDPARLEPGADLMLLRPDGKEEVLVDCTKASVADPVVSFDGKWIYYTYYHDLSPGALNAQRRHLPKLGADIFRLHVDTREIEQLTDGGFSPNTGVGQWDESNPLDPKSGHNYLGYGILNTGPMPLPGGRVAFTSNRKAYLPNKSYTYPNMQLYVMDEDGENVTAIAPMSLGSALHPTVLRDGRIMFSSFESQGVRDNRLWGLWVIEPDGRGWSPLVSAFKRPSAFHFATQLSDEDIVVVDYYNQNNNGFGALYRFPVRPPPGVAPFHGAFDVENPPIAETTEIGKLTTFRMPFTPYGMHSISPFTHGSDQAAPIGPGGERVGKFTHPSAAPSGDLLAVWTPGPANDLDRPTPKPYYDGGIVIVPGGLPVHSPDDLIVLANDPKHNEAWPRAVLPYESIHGVAAPNERPWLPNDGTLHPALPKGTPYGLVGTSSVYRRESFPGLGVESFDGLDPFNTSHNAVSSNWLWQGADAGKYSNADVWAVRVLMIEPTTHLSYGPNSTGVFGRHFSNHANERLRILGEIPLRKEGPGGEPVLDPLGDPDTSFVVKIPADTPYTFQTIDRNGMVLNMAQTWHQVRPGERQVNCGGCHAHSKPPLSFDLTAAAKPGYTIHDLSKVTPIVTQDAAGAPDLVLEPTPAVDVEFYRDIRPILASRCVGCHTKTDPDPPGKLVLDDHTMFGDLPGDYQRLANDPGASFGHPPVISTGTWRDTNASRYVRRFQSRRSLLMWKLFGQRLDGWTNADHPTETVPGVKSTLPAGADANLADLDFTGTIMPPPDSGVPPLTIAEKMTFARWIDLGAPIDIGSQTGNAHLGWFADDLRPVVTVGSPRPGHQKDPITVLRFGIADAHSGLDLQTLSVTADFPVQGQPAGAELKSLAAEVADGVYEIALAEPVGPLVEAHVRVEVADHQGNFGRVDRRFSTVPSIPPLGLFAPNHLPEAATGHPYDADLKAGGGVPPYSFAVTGGKLPSGLALEAGRVVGTPKKKSSSSFRVTVSDSTGKTAGTEFHLEVAQALELQTSSLPAAAHGKSYQTTLKTKGGIGKLAFAVTDGQLPPGITLDEDSGALLGVPLAVGDFVFVAEVGDTSGDSASIPLTLTVESSLKVKTKKLATGATGKPYGAKLAAKGGVAPYTWSVASTPLPPGLSLDPEQGTLSGVPAEAGTTTVTLRVVDAAGVEALRSLKLKVKAK